MNDANFPELNHDHVEIWVGLLADGELSATQRAMLFEFLEQHPEYWRCCALAFWDSLTLKQWLTPSGGLLAEKATLDRQFESQRPSSWSVPSNDSEKTATVSSLAPGLSVGKDTKRHWILGPALACALGILCCLISGLLFLGWNVAHTNWLASRVQWRQDVSLMVDVQQLLLAELQAERNSFRSLGSLFPNQPQLIEIENTPARAVFLTDRPLSPELMDWLVRYGTDVQVRPHQPESKNQLWESLRNPVLEIEVVKLSSLTSY